MYITLLSSGSLCDCESYLMQCLVPQFTNIYKYEFIASLIVLYTVHPPHSSACVTLEQVTVHLAPAPLSLSLLLTKTMLRRLVEVVVKEGGSMPPQYL